MKDDRTEPSAELSDPVPEIAEQERLDRVVDTEEFLLVDFYAEWCGPCQSMAPVVEELATETDASVVKVNVEESPLLAHQYDVQAIPTFLGLREGEEVGRLVGRQTREEIERLLD